MRLMVVEDDGPLRGALCDGLRDAGFAVDAADSAEVALASLETEFHDLLVLDLGLPGCDGLTLLKVLRDRRMTLPVLVLTARGAVEDRVTGLDAGADDYMPKPFAFVELLARIRALLRRGESVVPAVIRVGDLELDPARFAVHSAGRPVTLTVKEFAILEYLMRHPGELVTRTTLLENCWDSGYEGLSNLVDVHLSRIRRKIDRPGSPSLLHTVRGSGVILRARP
jgi:two-component system OmpR family response regulator